MFRWMASRVRLYRPDRNPLRRRSDRIEALFVAVFLLVFATGIVLAPVFGRMVYDDGVEAERSGRWVTARLEHDVPRPSFAAYAGEAMPRVKASWTGPDGRLVTGMVPVAWGAKAGSTTRVWVDASGHAVNAPPHRAETVARSIAVGLTSVLLAGGVAAGGYTIVRAVLDRRRHDEWAAAWLTAEREWRRRKQA